MTLTLANASLVENGPSTTATLTRTGDLSQALSVAIASSDTTEVVAPGTVAIPAGQASTTFTVTPVDDAIVDGLQAVTLTATALTGGTSVGLDTSYGNGGLATVPLEVRWDPGYADVLALPDGKTVAVGPSKVLTNAWAVSRLTTDGRLDSTFGGVGTVHTLFPGTVGSAFPRAVTVQPDGKLLVAGSVDNDRGADWGLARYNPDGTLDSTFGTGGLRVYDFGKYSIVAAVQVEANGNILVSGIGGTSDGFYVARLDSTGARIAERTLVVDTDPMHFHAIDDMAVGADGKILLVGHVGPDASSFVVVRLTAALAPDTSFAAGGVRTLPATAFGSQYATAEPSGVAVLPGGKVVVAGTVQSPNIAGRGDFAAARLNADGTLDATFAGDGTATLNLGTSVASRDDGALGLAVQPDGKVVLGGYTWPGVGGSDQAIARLNADGTPDLTLNGTGWYVAPNQPSLFEQIYAISLQPDGRLVAVAGYYTDFWVARFNLPTGDRPTATAALTVADDDVVPASLTLTISPTTFSEAAGTTAATGTVTRGGLPLNVALVVTLASNDTTEATVPASVTIPAGQASASFSVAAMNDTLTDGTQAVRITATAAGLTATANISVTDDEPALTVTIDRASVLEQAGANAAVGTVTRANTPLDQALVVNLTSSDTTEATVPASVTIPAGQASATFPVSGVDDTITDGPQGVTITATATGPGAAGPIAYDTAWGSSGWISGVVRGRVAVQVDGKLLVAGTYGTVGSNADFVVRQYNANGTTDATFGTNGATYVNAFGPSDQLEAILVQPDGKVLLIGSGTSATTLPGTIVLARLLANGALDTSFGTGGISRLNFGTSVAASPTDAALQSDGKIVLTGNVGGAFAVARLTANGTLDTTFDGDGWATTAFSAANSRAMAVAVQPDGKIVAIGHTNDGTAAQKFVLARYNANGSLDTTFNTTGKVESALNYAYQSGSDVVVQADGKIVLAGSVRANATTTSNDFVVVRYTTTGSVDTGYAASGVVYESAASTVAGAPVRLILQPDGRIIAAGTTGAPTTSRSRILRLSTTGAVEARTDSTWTTSSTQSIALDTAGNVYLAYNYGSGGTSGYVDRFKTTTGSVAVGTPATTRLNVLDNEPFAAVADAYSATEDTTLVVGVATGVRANDTVTAGISVAAEVLTQPTRGTLTLAADGSFTYRPNPDAFGTDTFTYRLRDGTAYSNTATATITVANVNDAPVALDDAYTVDEDTTLSPATAAAQTSLTMVSETGDYIGQGRTYNLSPATGTFTVSGTAAFVRIRYYNPAGTADWWDLYFRSQYDSVPLTPGTYLNAERASFRTVGKPGLDVSGQGRGSNTLTGQFTILQIETNAAGQITRFAADFEQHSEGWTSALRGSVRLNYAPGGTGVLTNDTDADGDPLTVALVSGPSHGQLTLNPNGTFIYKPAANYNGPDSFQYRASDGALVSNVTMVNLTVRPVDDLPPVTVADTATTAEDTPAVIDVLANDTDPQGLVLTPAVVTQPANGTASVNAAGRVVYTPRANFFGTDIFTYRATSSEGAGNAATVTVTVTPVPDAPVATSDSYDLNQGGTRTVGAPGVLGNDTDPDGDPLTAALVSGPGNGTLTLNPDGSFTYVPAPAFFGTDTFTYAAVDGTGMTVTALVKLLVVQTNRPPTAADDVAAGDEDQIIGIDVLANDTDPDGNLLSALVLTQPAHGSAAVSANNGRVYYTPAANWFGTDTFTYRAFDGLVYSAPATVTVTVRPVDDAPIARPDSFDVLEDNTLTVGAPGVLGNDTDIEGDPITAGLVTSPANGTLTLNADGSFTYTPNSNFNGQDRFTYRPSDGQLSGTPVTVTINVAPVNDPPVGNADFLTTYEDSSLNILPSDLLKNDTDPEQNPLLIGSYTQPAHGTLTRAVSFIGYVYRPNPNFFGTDTFTYRPSDTLSYGPSDGQLLGNETTVTITVVPVADAPVGVNDAYTVAEDGTLIVPAAGVLANDTDPDSPVLTAVLVSGPAHGTLNLAANGGFTYTPNANYNGPDTFTYRANDGSADSNPVTVSITVTAVNHAPIGTPDVYTVGEDGVLTVPATDGVLVNDTDADGDTLTVDLLSGPASGGLILSPNGRFTYTPSPNFFGTDTFTYRPVDGQVVAANPVTVTITVTPVNDVPVGLPDALAAIEDTPLFITTPTLLANDLDPDGDQLTLAAVTQPAHGTLTAALTTAGYVYRPDPNFFGTDTFTYRPFDGLVLGDVVTVTITVAPVNDPPTATPDTMQLAEDTTGTAAVLANDADVDGDALTVTGIGQAAHGTVSLSAAGVTYTPAADFFGSDSFTYTISDGKGGTATGTVTIFVSAVNDAPTLAALDDRTIATGVGQQTVTLAGITAGAPNEDDVLTVTATSSNPGLIPNPTVVYSSPVSTGTLLLTPIANASGTAVITVTVSDGQLSVVRQFTVTVTSVNSAPTTTGLPAVTLLEDATATNIPLGDGFADAESGSAGLTYTVVGNTNATLFSAVTVTGGTLKLTPAANANGSATLTIRATDTGGLSVQTTLFVTVTPVSDAPSFTPGGDQTVTAGSGPKKVGGWATGISRGPADEAAQGLTFLVSTSNPELFVVPPAIDPATGTLTFIPEASATGTATVTVTLRDTGGGTDTSTPRTFTIALTPNGLPTAVGVRKIGTDVIITGGEGADTVTITVQGVQIRVEAYLSGGKYVYYFPGVSRVVVDTKGGNDTITFASTLTIPTWTDAGAGDDTVTGGGGPDEIYLGAGDDTADGGAGDDFIAGGAGADVIQGGVGSDTIYGGDGNDLIIGGPQVDQLFGQDGNDIVIGGSAAVSNPATDSLRKVLTDWDPTRAGVYADLRTRLQVSPDGTNNRLTGGTGTDWFWAVTPPDTIDDLEPGEQRN
ncbi:tandem-95 repeat protein [Limnoglobus roseus]|uniref:tandem-95 repeat protein n=1 Tax=Limnoglobus roseus TaxID=2598579 RepID=UPI00143D07C4|nr:Ig-like domain-containing protein [Limnoglobus roseus]